MTRGRIVLAVILAGILLWLLPPLHQNEDYHHFADQRTLLEIPNFWNVVSNAPFAIVGLLGLIALGGAASRILFAGVFLTAFGSAYYHLAPDDARLVWDRLPMTIVFMTLFALVINERIRPIKHLPSATHCRNRECSLVAIHRQSLAVCVRAICPDARDSDLAPIRPGVPGLWPVIAMLRAGESCGAVRRRDLLCASAQRTHLEASPRRARDVVYSALAQAC